MSEVEVHQSKFCGDCGKSHIPLQGIHVLRNCKECGKTIYVAEPGEGGKGIRIEKGDRFQIPSGAIQISLDPRIGGTLYRPGISFFVEQLILSGSPKDANGIEETLKVYENLSDDFLKKSDLFKGLNLDDPGDADKAFGIANENHSSREWWAFVMGISIENIKDAIKENDAKKAALSMHRALSGYVLFQLKEQVFEDTLWRGYLANKSVFAAAAAQARSQEEANSYKELEYKIITLSEAALNIYVKDGRPIGPRIGVTGIPDQTIKPLMEYQISLLERRRVEEKEKKEYKYKWSTLVATFVTGILGGTGIVFFIFKAVIEK